MAAACEAQLAEDFASQDGVTDVTKPSVTAPSRKIPRVLQAALALTALAWAGAAEIIAGRAARGIAGVFQQGAIEPLLNSCFVLFLLVIGFRALDWLAARGWQRVDPLPLPRRKGWTREWGLGAAIGWACSLAVAVPALVSLNLHTRLAAAFSLTALTLALLTVLLAALVQETIFRGYAFIRLSAAIGPTASAILLSIGYAFVLLTSDPPSHLTFALVNGACLGVLLSIAYLRTHALWLGWGLHFAYRAVTLLVLGLPVSGRGAFGALTDTYVSGPRWLSGGRFGFDAAAFTVLTLCGAILLLIHASRDYAWNYTHREITGAGYAVTIAPPAAHTAMEKAAAPPALVQILPTTSTTFSHGESSRKE